MNEGTVLLDIKDLSVTFRKDKNAVNAVIGLSLQVYKGQCLGIVGESGSGKSVTSLSLMNLLKNQADIKGSVVYKQGHETMDILSASEDRLLKVRGNKIAMIFQEPMNSLNPVRKCGSQIREVLQIHRLAPQNRQKQIVYDLLEKVQIKEVDRVYKSYPHELSGGQQQRVNIAIALAGNPDILICDEPTTALDLTVQKEIIELLKQLIIIQGLSLIFVCHDLDLVTEICDSVAVMYQGKLVEHGVLPETFTDPKHPYTRALLRCKPRLEDKGIVLPTVEEIVNNTYRPVPRKSRKLGDEILRVENLTVRFEGKSSGLFVRKKYFNAVEDLTFSLREGEVLGIVGESGSGKSTVANVLSGLLRPFEGKTFYKGGEFDIDTLRNDSNLRSNIQLVFQDPYSSLNPRMKIGKCIREPIVYHKLRTGQSSVEGRVDELLNQVGLSLDFKQRYPHELSGGQRQRVCIARSLAVEPELLICDESVSALDVSIQAQILNLLDRLKNELNLSMIFISHDLSVIHYLCDNILVMNQGEKVEYGDADAVIRQPSHPYTQKLISSIPSGF